jgi:hypothetical protein
MAPISSFKPFWALTTRLGIFKSPREFRLGLISGRTLPSAGLVISTALLPIFEAEGESFWLRERRAVGASCVPEDAPACTMLSGLEALNMVLRGGVDVPLPNVSNAGEVATRGKSLPWLVDGF